MRMSALLKLGSTMIWMLILPFLAGYLPCCVLPEKERTCSRIFLSGYLLNFAIFECLGVPILLLLDRRGFTLLLVLYVMLLTAAAVFGAYQLRRSRSRLPRICFLEGSVTEKLLWAAAALLFLVIAAMSVIFAFYDGDDAYYVVESVQTWQSGLMYYYLPYTGTNTTLDVRHALAMLPIWFAALAKMTGTHPTILIHSFSPALILLLSDCAFAEAARLLFADRDPAVRNRMSACFMILVGVLQLFGAVSIYTPEYFVVLRPWQGKSLFAAVLLPAAFAVLLTAGSLLPAKSGKAGEDDEKTTGQERYVCILGPLLILAGCLMTEMAPLFLTGLLLLGVILLRIGPGKNNPKLLYRLTRSFMIPAAVYIILMIVLLLPHLVRTFGGYH